MASSSRTLIKTSLFSSSVFQRSCAAIAAGAIGFTGFAISEEEKQKALSPTKFTNFKLSAITKLTPNTNLYRFDFPNKGDQLGLVVASCLVVKEKIDGKVIVRPYTPVSKNSETGHVDLIVKAYPAPWGKMGRHLESMKVGDELAFKGPFKKFEYKANSKKSIGMIAGGTGITPMLQVVREILENPRDRTQVHLIFANETEQDIILRNQLDALSYLYDNFHVHYTLTHAPEAWRGSTGYVNQEMVETHLPPPSDDCMIMVCGPPPMMKAISGDKNKDKSQGELQGLLKAMGYTKDNVYKF